MQRILADDYHEKHFVSICFVCAVHYDNFMIDFQNTLRNFFEKKTDELYERFYSADMHKINFVDRVDALMLARDCMLLVNLDATVSAYCRYLEI